VGHDPFDLSSIPIKNGDAVLYSFGQIDIGWHLGKQIDTCGKDLDEILETLAVNYLNSIKITTQNHPDLLKVVYSILPPSPDSGLSIPYAGTIELRAEATKILNANLRLLCPKYGFEFLDVYDDFSDADGILNPEIRDDVSFFHIALEYYDFVNQRFFEIYNRI
jgi:hypothetical protein